MARKGFGSAMNRVLNFVGLVDTDEEPQRSNAYSLENNYDSARQSGYTPRARRNDRPQQQDRMNSGRSYGYGSSRSGGYDSRSSRQSRDTYSEWNTAPRSQNRYANNIYDDDTTLRGNVSQGYTGEGYRSDDRDNRRSNYDNYGYDNRRGAYDDEPQRGDDRMSMMNEPQSDRTGRYEEDFNAPVRRRDRRERMERPDPMLANDDERRMTTVEPRNARSRSGEVVVFDINDLEDCRMVILSLIDNKTVIISVESLDKAMIRRVEDTLCGAVCALDATIRRTSEVSYLIAPSSIEVRGTRKTVERRY